MGGPRPFGFFEDLDEVGVFLVLLFVLFFSVTVESQNVFADVCACARESVHACVLWLMMIYLIKFLVLVGRVFRVLI